MSLFKKIKISVFILALIWLVYGVNIILPVELNKFGIQPRTLNGIFGIFFAPFLHGNLPHIISNSVPLFVLTFGLFLLYEKKAYRIWFGIMLIGGFLVWLLAGLFLGSSLHIGASGVIYGLVAFFIASGVYQKSFKAILISIIVILVYGSLIFGIFPTQPRISWQSHLFGALAGIIMAYKFRNIKFQ